MNEHNGRINGYSVYTTWCVSKYPVLCPEYGSSIRWADCLRPMGLNRGSRGVPSWWIAERQWPMIRDGERQQHQRAGAVAAAETESNKDGSKDYQSKLKQSKASKQANKQVAKVGIKQSNVDTELRHASENHRHAKARSTVLPPHPNTHIHTRTVLAIHSKD